MANVRVSSSSSTPVYQQIVEQIRYMIEAGQLASGERLPSARLLAENVHVNRNTVAKAYATLRDMGLIATKGAAGTVVTADAVADHAAGQRDEARRLLMEPIRAAVKLGLSPDEVGQVAAHLARQVGSEQLSVVFVECNQERASAFAEELAERLQVEVKASLISELDEKARDCELLVTTFFHLAEVRRWVADQDQRIETAAVVVSPHIQTLVTIASLPEDARVAVRYTTDHQADQVRDWLTDAGSPDVTMIPSGDGSIPADLDVLVVPAEHPELGEGAAEGTRVIRFGGSMDEGSVRMIDEVLNEIRHRSIATGSFGSARKESTPPSA